jgi:hypothetical protein
MKSRNDLRGRAANWFSRTATLAGRIALCMLVSQLSAQQVVSPASSSVAAYLVAKTWLPVTAASGLREIFDSQEAAPGTSAADYLTVSVAKGEGAINIVGQGPSHPIVVLVQYATGAPVEDAVVTFFLPSDGPSGIFPNGTRNVSITTDNLGHAMAAGFTPNSVTGDLEIKVTVALHGSVAHAIVHQTNSSSGQAAPAGAPASGGTPSGAATKKKSNTMLLVLVGVGAAAAVGAALALKGGSSSSSSTPPPAVTTVGISIGTGSLGH